MTTCTYAYIHTHVCRVVYLQVCKLYIVHLFFPAIVSPSSVKVVFALLSGHNMKSDLLGWWIQCADHAANKSLSMKLVPEMMDCLLAGWLAGWPACLIACSLARSLASLRACLLARWFPSLLARWFPCLLASLLACWFPSWLACLLPGQTSLKQLDRKKNPRGRGNKNRVPLGFKGMPSWNSWLMDMDCPKIPNRFGHAGRCDERKTGLASSLTFLAPI